jgi:Sulfotransferase family
MLLIEDGPEIELNVGAVVDAARRQSGLSDMGDARFLQGLTALINSIRADVWDGYKSAVRSSIGRSLVHLLVARMAVLDCRKRYPEIERVAIEKPIFFIGMGRTGSTLIQTLMAQDPGHIAPQLWETLAPAPPPIFGIQSERRDRVAQIMSWYLGAMPDLLAQHPYFIEDGYRALAECGSICELSFASLQFFAYFGAKSYVDWFLNADHTETIAFHKMFLQHLQWGREGRHWMCKAVEHGALLHELQLAYPDAVFVWTHRDPYKQAASLASTLAVIRERCGGLEEPAQAGADAVHAIRTTIDKGMATRAASDESRYYDVYFDDLVERPIDTLRGLYEKCGRPFNAEAQLAMETWLRNNRADKGGAHSYTAEQFGLSRDLIQRQLEGYLARFGRRWAGAYSRSGGSA